jgi:hypothetical protein
MTGPHNIGIFLSASIAVIGTSFALPLQSQPNQQTPPADLVLRGGRILTLDDQVPEAEALAARDGKIVAIGSNAAVAEATRQHHAVRFVSGRADPGSQPRQCP